jgi:hypothetical protein
MTEFFKDPREYADLLLQSATDGSIAAAIALTFEGAHEFPEAPATFWHDVRCVLRARRRVGKKARA